MAHPYQEESPLTLVEPLVREAQEKVWAEREQWRIAAETDVLAQRRADAEAAVRLSAAQEERAARAAARAKAAGQKKGKKK